MKEESFGSNVIQSFFFQDAAWEEEDQKNIFFLSLTAAWNATVGEIRSGGGSNFLSFFFSKTFLGEIEVSPSAPLRFNLCRARSEKKKGLGKSHYFFFLLFLEASQRVAFTQNPCFINRARLQIELGIEARGFPGEKWKKNRVPRRNKSEIRSGERVKKSSFEYGQCG